MRFFLGALLEVNVTDHKQCGVTTVNQLSALYHAAFAHTADAESPASEISVHLIRKLDFC